MSNYTRGIADAMLESRASGAESAAAFAAADAAHARRMLHDSEMSADRQAEEWRNYANKLLDTVYERTAEVSAAMVVIDSVIKEMESVLPPGQREQLRQAVARRARDRLEELVLCSRSRKRSLRKPPRSTATAIASTGWKNRSSQATEERLPWHPTARGVAADGKVCSHRRAFRGTLG